MGRRVVAFLPLITWAVLPFLDAETRHVVLPAVVDFTVCTWFFVGLLKRNQAFPALELGTAFGAALLLYSVVPILSFLAGGLAWTSLSDGRLLVHNPGPQEVGDFSWLHTAFLTGFCVTYLVFRGKRSAPATEVQPPDRATLIFIIGAYLLIQAYLLWFSFYYGVTLESSYLNGGLDAFQGYYQAPFFIQQITHNLMNGSTAAKICLVAVALLKWRHRGWRYALLAWLVFETVTSFMLMGSRTYVAMLLFGTVLLYHRLVCPLTLRRSLLFGVLLVGGFSVYGLMRDWDGSVQNAMQVETRVWTANNDFQVLWSSAYDVKMSLESGRLGPEPFPWQIYFIDFFLLIPSQLLPFDKIEPSAWYYGKINATSSAMFGVIGQGVIGYGLPDLFLRGAFLGGLFAWLHRKYMKYSTGFWPTVFYVYFCIWSHYVFRSTTIWPVYFVVYDLLPIFLFVQFWRFLSSRRLSISPAHSR